MQKGTGMDFVRKYSMVLCAAVLFVFFALVIVFTNSIQLLVTTISVDAKFWPRMIGYSGCVISLLMMVQSLLEVRAGVSGKETAEPEESGEGAESGGFHAAKTLGLIFLYILGLQYLGFVVMTLLYLFCQFLVLADKERRNVPRLAGITAVFTGVIYIIFRYVFQMMLPAGTLWALWGGR